MPDAPIAADWLTKTFLARTQPGLAPGKPLNTPFVYLRVQDLERKNA